MNSSKNFRIRRAMAIMAMLVGSMLGTLAYGQECDPSWFNPWAGPETAAAVQTAPKQAATAKHSQKIKAVSSTRRAEKAHLKRVASANRPS